MSYDTADIKIIAEQLRWAKDKGYSTAMLLGAGMSVSAGIPAAKGMIEEIKRQFPKLCATCKKQTYPAHMSLLAPAQRRKLIGSFIDKARINLAHLYIGALVKERYVDRILTTNFDPLAVRSLALSNIYPAVYDFAASQSFIPGEAAQLSVYYLHGQRDGFVLLNTEDEINRHSEKLKNVFQDVNRGRCWIVIGYSGENDPVFERLAEVDVFQHKLFWVGYKEKEPADHVFERILNPQDKFGYYVKGYDADKFFLELAKELGLPEPQIISRPFTHLKEAISTIAEYPIDDKFADPTRETKRWIDAAIKGFEKGRGFQYIEIAKRKKIQADEIIRKARDIWVHSRFKQIDDIFEDVVSSEISEAIKYLAYALYNWGTDLYDLAKMKKGNEAEKLFKESFDKYGRALKIKPDLHVALNNWGLASYQLAEMKKGKEAEKLLKQSFEKYGRALKIKADDHEVLYNWGLALYELAKRKKGKEAEKLLKQSFDKYGRALKIKPDLHVALNNWGAASYQLAEMKKGKEAEKLLKQSFEKYGRALKIKPDYHEALNNWGLALCELAKTKKGKEAEKLFKQSFEKYGRALEIKPDDHAALNNWGLALYELAKMKKGKEAEKLFKQSFEKYGRALEIKPDDHAALNNWGNALSDLAEMKKGKEAEKLFKQSFEKYGRALEIKPDYHEALNNWGLALYELAKMKKGKEAEKLFKQSFEKYGRALEIKPDDHAALNNWGLASYQLAEMKKGKEAEKLLKQSFEKYGRALKIKADDHEVLYNWGLALSDLAEMKKGKEAEKLFKQSFEKYGRALEIKPDYHEALNNWGLALCELAKTKKGKEAEKLFKQALEKLMQEEKIKEGTAAYDIACVYSLMGETRRAFVWLEKGLKMKSTPTRSHILADTDLDNIKHADDSRRLMDAYRPE